jgi:hypothetical protein
VQQLHSPVKRDPITRLRFHCRVAEAMQTR